MLIDELTALQKRHGYLPEESLHTLSESTHIPLYEIYGVAGFYPHFRLEPPPPVEIRVCSDLSCHLHGACELFAALKERAVRAGLDDRAIRKTSCLGQCDGAPAAAVNGRSYARVTPDHLDRYIETLAQGRPLRRQPLRQRHGAAQVDPYAGRENGAALRRLIRRDDAEGVLAAVKDSGLRGMGGAGFPAGVKWELVRKAPGEVKYVVCNADESEPGTCKDRELLRTVPHLVVEGMIIGARIVGARRGYVFLRHEYDRAREALERTIRRFYRDGALGDRVFGAGPAFHLEIFDSPGGYICGEETALLEALEGKRAEPRNKPPFPGTHGLHGKPTLINNVETFAWIPSIVLRGAEWFRSCGINGAAGLKYIALSGHVRRPGVYEIPLGTTVHDLIEEYGGGVEGGRALKAFAPGGASSGFLPASMAHLPLDFDALAQAGSMLGSGAVVAVAEGTCMLDLAKNVTAFFRNESCGKCVPCRTGTQQFSALLDRITRGRSDGTTLDPVEDLADTMAHTSICGLGQAAPLAVTSVLQYFAGEVEAHITKRTCPSGVCFGGREG